MRSYYQDLKAEESLDELCNRFINLQQLEDLIEDLIRGNYDELFKYDYFNKLDRLSSIEEQSFIWLLNSPFYINKVSSNVIMTMLEDALKSKKWDLVSTLLALINKNLPISDIKLFKEWLHEDFPWNVEFKLYLTLLNLEKENDSLHNFLAYLEPKIDLHNKAHLVVVKLTTYSVSAPKEALEYLEEFDRIKYTFDDIDLRLIFFNALRIVIINYFDLENTLASSLKEKVNYFINWSNKLRSTSLKELVEDCFQTKKLKSIKNEILQVDSSFMDNSKPPELHKEWIITIKEGLKKMPAKLAHLN